MKNKQLVPLFLAASLISPVAIAQDTDSVVMKVSDKSITKSSFEYTYYKNAGHQLENTTPKEYMDLFVNYQLKVLAAEAAGIDTTAQFVKELEGYREQLAQPYLVDESVKEELIQEAYNRMKEEIEVSHILFEVSPGASYVLKQQALQTCNEVRERLIAGEDFATLAKEFSADPSAKTNEGYLGYITSGLTVYPFETAAYTTPVGVISEPVLTSYGYHLVKVTDRRPSQGLIKVAHIMTMIPQGAPEQMAQTKQQKIEEAYAKIEAGETFEDVVTAYSEDTHTVPNGGELQWFGTGQMVKEFSDAAFALTEEGEISQPIRSPYGWHIIKLIGRKPIAPLEEKRAELEKRIARDDRANKGTFAFIESLKEKYSYKLDTDLVEKLDGIPRNTPELQTQFKDSLSNETTPLFTYDDKAFTVADLVAYTTAYRDASLSIRTMQELAEMSTSHTLIMYENSRLEEQYPEFKNLVQEYRDGMLLFEISNREVWERSNTDTLGIQQYFKKNKRKYKWDEPRFKGYLVQCSSEEVAQKVKQAIATLAPDTLVNTINKTFNNDSIKQVKIVHRLYKAGDNEMVDNLVFATGELTSTEELPVVFVEGEILKKYPTEYTDVKGQVTSDYQKELEKKWLKKLHKTYSVDIDKDVLKTVNSR